VTLAGEVMRLIIGLTGVGGGEVLGVFLICLSIVARTSLQKEPLSFSIGIMHLFVPVVLPTMLPRIDKSSGPRSLCLPFTPLYCHLILTSLYPTNGLRHPIASLDVT
jgi:hypothetical protein